MSNFLKITMKDTVPDNKVLLDCTLIISSFDSTLLKASWHVAVSFSSFVSKFCLSSFCSFVSSLLAMSFSSFVSIFLRALSQTSVTFGEGCVQSVGRGVWLLIKFDGLAPFAAYDIITASARKTNERMLKPLSVFNEYFDWVSLRIRWYWIIGNQLAFHFHSYQLWSYC